jgi:hypothetical protein
MSTRNGGDDAAVAQVAHAAHAEHRCSFCGAGPSADAKVIPGPKANICFPCVPRVAARGAALLAEGRGGIQRLRTGEELPCSFCDMAGVRWMVMERGVRICDECVRICEELIAEDCRACGI